MWRYCVRVASDAAVCVDRRRSDLASSRPHSEVTRTRVECDDQWVLIYKEEQLHEFIYDILSRVNIASHLLLVHK